MHNNIKYIIGVIISIMSLSVAVIFARSHVKKTYAKAPNREYLV